MNDRTHGPDEKKDDAHETGPGRAALPLPFDAADGDGVPFVPGDPACAACSTISRFPRGDADREWPRSSSAGLFDDGERVAIGGRLIPPGAPWPARPAGRGCGGSIVGIVASCGLDG